MSEEKPGEARVPPQAGKLFFEGRKATQFWVRAFGLDTEIEVVREMIAAKPERKKGAVPVIAEYEVDERLKFIYLIQAEVDALGIQDGVGLLYWASPEFEEEAFRLRNESADDLLKKMEVHPGFDEIMEIEMKREK